MNRYLQVFLLTVSFFVMILTMAACEGDTLQVMSPSAEIDNTTISTDVTQPITEPVTTEPEVTEPSITEPSDPTEPTEPTVPTEPPAEHEHIYESLVTDASCTLGGFTTYTCECGDTYTDEITEPVGHQWGDWVTVQEPSSVSEGKAQRKCDFCIAEETKALPVAHTHSYTSKVTKEPTCKNDGVKTYQCACGDSYTESIKTLAHNYTSQVIKPSCTTDGYTKHTCSGCGKSYTDSTVTASHSFGPWKLEDKTPKYGILVRTCDHCSEYEQDYDYSQAMTQEEIQQDILRLINIEREKAGVPPLEYCYDVQAAADIRADEITTKFSHTRPDGRSCFTVFGDCNFNNYWSAGENIAMGYVTTTAVMNGWMNSTGHRENILAEGYTHVVIGYNDNHWVQLFMQIPD